MTELDHSSVVSLLADLYLHRGCVFRFMYDGDNQLYPVWKLNNAYIITTTASSSPTRAGHLSSRVLAGGGHIQFIVEYGSMQNRVWTSHPGTDADYLCLLENGRLFWNGLHFAVVVVVGPAFPPPCGGPSADDSQRDRLDDNLRGVFA